MSNLQSVLAFDGSKDYIEVPYTQELNPAQFTLSCWAKVEGGQGKWRSPITCRTAKGSSALGGYILYAGANNKWQFWTGNGGWVTLQGPNIVLNTWTHVAATYDGSTMKLYINGELAGQPVPSKILINKTHPLRIGAGVTEGNPGYFFNGQIAEVRLWNIARSQDEIKQSMDHRLTGEEEGLVAYWPLNEGSGNTISNLTDAGNQGTIDGGTWTQEALNFIQPLPISHLDTQSFLTFDGENDYVATTLDAQPSALPATTWEAWIKPTRNISHWDMILSTDDGGWDRFVGTNGGQFRISHGKEAWSAVAADINQWQHIAVVYSADKQIKFYKNGTEYIYPGKSSIGSTKKPFYIGRSAGNASQCFQGSITEVRVWNCAKEKAEIQEKMHCRLKGDESGLVGYWPLNEASGTLAADQTSQGNNGTINGATWEQGTLDLTEKSPPSRSVLTFDNTKAPTDYVILNPLNSFPNRVLTVELWLKTDSKNPGTPISYAAKNSVNAFILYNYQSLCPFVCEANTNSRIAFNDGKWHHCAMTWDSNTGQVQIYKDGQQEFSGTLSKGKAIPNGGALILGQEQDSVAGSFDVKQAFRGQMSEVRIWDQIRTAQDIQDNMHCCLTGNESGLVLYWPLDEGTGTQATDKTGHGNHGTLNGITWETSDLQLTPAKETTTTPEPSEESSSTSMGLVFDGKKDYVEIPPNSALDLTDNFTIEAWIKPETLGKRIVDKNIGGQSEGFTFDTYPKNLRFINKGVYFTSRSPLKIGTWQHVAVTFKNEANGAKLYINGEEENTATPTRVGTVTKLPVRLGSQADKPGNLFKGEMAEVRMWNQVRSADEIKASMNCRLTGEEDGLVGYWPLNEGSGTIVADRSNNDNSGTINNGSWQPTDLVASAPITSPEEPEETNLSSALRFDGVDDYVAIPTSEWETVAFSVELWAKASKKQGNYSSVISISDRANLNGSFQIDAMGGYYRFNHTEIQVRLTKVSQQWQHLAVTYDGSNIQTYVNGELMYEKAVDSMPTVFREYVLGKNRNSDRYFAGELSDVRVWNKALTAEEIQGSMSSRLVGNEPGLVVYYPLNEGSGNAIADKTENSQPSIINGVTWQPKSLEIEPAPSTGESNFPTQSILSFDGANDYIDTTCLLNFGAEAFTLEAWVYSTGTSGVILSAEKHGVSLCRFRLAQDNHTIFFMFSDGPGNTLLWESKKGYLLQSKVEPNQWSHIAIKRVGTTHQMYVDGKLATECETSEPIDWKNSTVPLRLGAQHPYSGEGGAFYFQGKLADVRIWNTERSANDIQTQRYVALSAEEPGLVGYWPLDEGENVVGDRTGNSSATLYGGTWENQPIQFLRSGDRTPVTLVHHGLTGDEPELLKYWALNQGGKGLQVDSLMDVQPYPQVVLTLDGVNDYIDTNCHLSFATEAFTLEAWVYSTGKSGVILSSEKHGASTHQFRLAQDNNTIFFMISEGPGNTLLWDSKKGYLLKSTVVKDEWSHIAIKRVGTTHQMYVNGILTSECETSEVIDWTNKTVLLRLGAQHSSSGEGAIFYFQGKLADIRIWNIERTAEEIATQRQYLLAGDEPGLVGYWPLNEGGNLVGDRTGNSTATLYGGTWKQQDLRFLQPETPLDTSTSVVDRPNPQSILSFDGTDDYIDTTCLLNFGAEAFTLEAWVYSTGTSGVILSAEKHGVSPYRFRLAQDNNAILFMLSDGPGNTLLWESKTGYLLRSIVLQDQWSHIAVKRVGTTHQMYVNGELTSQCETEEEIDWKNSIVPLRLGAQHSYSGEGSIFFFKGKLADVRIWNTERTAEEIKAERQSLLAGDEPGLVGYWPLNEGGNLVGDRTGNSTATLHGGTWEQNDVPFLLPVSEAQTTAITPKPATPEPTKAIDLDADSDFDKSVISITILTGSNHVGGQPETIYGKAKRKKRKKRKKQDKYLSPLEKLVRDVAKRQDKASRTYFERHKRSNKKKSNGWIKDFAKNYTKSVSKFF